MKIRVHTVSKTKRKKIKDALTFFLCRLLEPADRIGLVVDVVFIEDKDLEDAGDLGWCGPMDNKKYPLEYEIALHRKCNPNTYISTLAHECVHLRQYRLGELKAGSVFATFNGKRYNIDTTHWEDRPWEHDANKWEAILYQEYKDIFHGECC